MFPGPWPYMTAAQIIPPYLFLLPGQQFPYLTKYVIPEVLSNLNTLYYSDSRRKIQGIPSETLSINATYHDHSLDFQCWTSNFSADSGILMMQEIVLRFSCDCFLRMLSCKEIWKSGIQLCGILPWDTYGWFGVNAFVGWELVPTPRPWGVIETASATLALC